MLDLVFQREVSTLLNLSSIGNGDSGRGGGIPVLTGGCGAMPSPLEVDGDGGGGGTRP